MNNNIRKRESSLPSNKTMGLESVAKYASAFRIASSLLLTDEGPAGNSATELLITLVVEFFLLENPTKLSFRLTFRMLHVLGWAYLETGRRVLIATKWALEDCRHGATPPHAIAIKLIMGQLKNGQIFKAGSNPQNTSPLQATLIS